MIATTSTPTLEQLAAQANLCLTRSKRDDGTEYVHRKDDAPEWVGELCLAAHGDMMPDDWRYEFIEDALSAIENGDDEPTDIDSAYPYTADRTAWLASHLSRPGFCDEEAEEYSMEGTGVLSLIALGMGREMRETIDLVKTFLEERVTELEDEAEGADSNE